MAVGRFGNRAIAKPSRDVRPIGVMIDVSHVETGAPPPSGRPGQRTEILLGPAERGPAEEWPGVDLTPSVSSSAGDPSVQPRRPWGGRAHLPPCAGDAE
ncbi:hypothetical protein CORC01_12194 [Colletotrichum orchidophilum]|uniref:Uncharacterized protein n=1 Tax=Colletotrichum orchidophilum TaxID=1209926 RepID=A0A1G4ATQ1_9PEZI|nr:uncharacterized protein CORC01_12194 [Colletotrichum orchidophilum]OHE92476.1 hypothetical protein CORC01_12194 [Colletotrichum orchidophilum]